MKARVLVVDDEPDILELVSYNLREAGYEVTTAADGATALAEVRRRAPDLIVLDLNLPDVPGTEVCRRLRRESATEAIPIVMTTARGSEIDRVVGFELGADDYVVKPFSPRELVLRIGAVLRRRGPAPTEPKTLERIAIGMLEIDVGAHEARVAGDLVALTALEFKLLHELASRPGRLQTRDELLERVWGYAPGIETRTVDTHVKRLRVKLGDAREYVETVRGVGYRFRPRTP